MVKGESPFVSPRELLVIRSSLSLGIRTSWGQAWSCVCTLPSSVSTGREIAVEWGVHTLKEMQGLLRPSFGASASGQDCSQACQSVGWQLVFHALTRLHQGWRPGSWALRSYCLSQMPDFILLPELWIPFLSRSFTAPWAPAWGPQWIDIQCLQM